MSTSRRCSHRRRLAVRGQAAPSPGARRLACRGAPGRSCAPGAASGLLRPRHGLLQLRLLRRAGEGLPPPGRPPGCLPCAASLGGRPPSDTSRCPQPSLSAPCSPKTPTPPFPLPGAADARALLRGCRLAGASARPLVRPQLFPAPSPLGPLLPVTPERPVPPAGR